MFKKLSSVRFFSFRIIITIPQLLADAHGAEVRSAHGAILSIQVIGFLIILECPFRVKAQIELVFPAEFITCLTQSIVADFRSRMTFGKISGMCGNLISDYTYTYIFFCGKARCSLGVT